MSQGQTQGQGQQSRSRPLPLAGIRVLDLGQFIAIPFCSLWLAWLGAEVIVIESRRRMTSRTAPPFAEGREKEPNASGYFNQLYSSKKSVTVDMTTVEGRDLVRRLAGVCDVMVDNFSTGVLEKLGLGYEQIAALNPSIIMLSNGAFGRAGAMRNSRGLHSAVNLFSGVAEVTGYADSHPRILGGCIPDPLSGTYSGFAIMAAIYHRQKTGQGQFIDVAMHEAMLSLIPEAVIDLTLNDVEPTRIGNRDRVNAPHGIYQGREDDTWLAISVNDETQWAAFCNATGHPEWRSDPRFATLEARQKNVGTLDLAIEAWAGNQNVSEATDLLQSARVPSGPVLRLDELFEHEQLLARDGVVIIDHPVVGPRRQMALPWRMDSLGIEYKSAPLLGEHTHEILTGLLGITEPDYARLEAGGVLS
jgi:crotonobetainyl-CoA:carnitine CoA-transferase CaiB-like acyl-CoA transferase